MSRTRSSKAATGSPGSRVPPLAWDSLEGRDLPSREWVIPRWVPHHHLTLLPGAPGVGKTLLAQHIATAVAMGHEYLEPIISRRVLMWAGEDDHDELWRRQVPICSWMGIPLSTLTERLYLHSYCNHDITLATFRDGILTPTQMLAELRQQVQDYRAELVILDNVARLFGGNEIDRHQVTTFCAAAQAAISPAAGILLAHPARDAGSEFSGSGAWEAAVRSRLLLSYPQSGHPQTDVITQPGEDLRHLSRRKANYSSLNFRKLRLVGGVLIPEMRPEGMGEERRVDAREVVRRAIRTLCQLGQAGVLASRSPDYLPAMAQRFALLESVTLGDFKKAMYDLLKSRELIETLIPKYGHTTQPRRIALAGETPEGQGSGDGVRSGYRLPVDVVEV